MRQFLPLTALLVASMVLVLGNGLGGLLIPTRAENLGWSTDTIALIGASYALFFTLGCVVVPSMVARVGHIRTFGALGTLATIAMLLLAMQPTAWFWVAVRGMTGFSVAGSYMVLESWLNEKASNENRGLVFSIYMVISLVGQAVGPYLVALGNPDRFELFAWAAIIYASATLPLALTGQISPAPLTRVEFNFSSLWRNSPAACVGSFVTGAISGAWLALLPVYGSRIGLTTAAIATMLAAANLGSMVAQIPIGRLSDKIDRRIVMVGVGLIGVSAAVLIIVLPQPIPATVPVQRPVVEAGDALLLVGLMFLFGTALYTTYSLNVAHANDWARNVSFVTVASGLLILYGVGSTVGPLIAAQLMGPFGPNGLFVFSAAAHLLYAGFALWRITQRGNVALDDQFDFQPLPVSRTTPQTFELDARSNPDDEHGWDVPDDYDAVSGEA